MSDKVDATTQWARLVGKYPEFIPSEDLEKIDAEVHKLISFGAAYVRRDDPSREIRVVKLKRTAANVKPEHYRLKTAPALSFDDSRVHRFLEAYMRKSDYEASLRAPAVQHTISQDLV